MSKKLTGHLTQPLWFQSSLKLHQRQEVSLSFHLFCAHLPRSLHRSFPSGLCGFPLVQQKVGEKTNATKTNHPTRPCGQGWEGSSKAARPPPCHGSTTVSPIPRHRAPARHGCHRRVPTASPPSPGARGRAGTAIRRWHSRSQQPGQSGLHRPITARQPGKAASCLPTPKP